MIRHLFMWSVLVFLSANANLIAEQNVLLENREWSEIFVNSAPLSDKPRFLFIGDSICNGYFNNITTQIGNRAYCAKFSTSAFLTNPDYLTALNTLFVRYDFDLIHINNGLHGFGYTEKDYASGLTNLLSFIKSHEPQAKLIWCMSTPVRRRDDLSQYDPYKNPRVITRNQIAENIMTNIDIAINDLYTAMEEHPEYYREDAIHYNSAGVSVQSIQIVDIINSVWGFELSEFINGGFESGLSPWTFGGSNMSWGSSGTLAYEGSSYIYANSGNTIPAGSVEQTFNTENGGTYIVECQVGKRGIGNGSDAAKFLVEVRDHENGGVLLVSNFVYQVSGSTWPAAPNYRNNTFQFTADSAETTLRFIDQSENAGGNFDTYLDAISVSLLAEPFVNMGTSVIISSKEWAVANMIYLHRMPQKPQWWQYLLQ